MKIDRAASVCALYRNKFIVKKTFISIILSLSSTVHAEAYLCVGDQATGFIFNKSSKAWSQAKFNVKDAKYILSKGSGKWEWKKIGEKYGIECDSSFSEYGYMNCNSSSLQNPCNPYECWRSGVIPNVQNSQRHIQWSLFSGSF